MNILPYIEIACGKEFCDQCVYLPDGKHCVLFNEDCAIHADKGAMRLDDCLKAGEMAE